ncbi:Hypothetical predicted protein [Paramuricea clavata]|uniref:Uncharacterized protein n=1 Tax=Paramuricea clavata TaxID=317549 RepID=A0A6S7JFT4_PARCT|nr:Hypothetical predicted protein [Paramuricea clavata]
MKSYFVVSTLCIFALYCEFSNADEIEECPEFKPVGCFKDRSRSKNRALGRLLITDRDRSDKKRYSGKDIDWFNYGVYIHDLACRCAKFAKEKGFSHFGLQFYGECWSGPTAGITYLKYGESAQCANEYFGACEDPDEGACIGRANANFVYQLSVTPASGSGDSSVLE